MTWIKAHGGAFYRKGELGKKNKKTLEQLLLKIKK